LFITNVFKTMLKITNLKAETEGIKILEGVDLQIGAGEVHVLMGPNGSGKSTLAKVLMGHPAYKVTGGSIEFAGKDLLKLDVSERAKLGIYLAFQQPTEVPGVNFRSYLRMCYNARLPKEEQLPVFKFRKILQDEAARLEVNPELLERNLNEGLSGGEKKKTEILQMSILKPKLAILDETDSGLDIDSLKSVFQGVERIRKENPEMSLLIITHYHKIFDFVEPHFMHVIRDGKIIKTGGTEIIKEIEAKGFKD
jgi:Fe-S cluster assembly ATP-binding protein